MPEAVIVEAVRTPIGKRNGKLSGVRADELAAKTIAEVVRRTGIDPMLVEDVIFGCVTGVGEQGVNVARVAALIAGLPKEVPGTTVNRLCGSSQQAANFAAQAVMSGQHDIVIAGGIESMSRIPMMSDLFLNGDMVMPSEQLTDKYNLVPQGVSAEMIAKQWKISRQEVDAFSLESHARAMNAIEKGYFQREIMPVENVTFPDGSTGTFSVDEGPRGGTTMEKMGSLRLAFDDDGVVTAGNSSQISDGAAAMLIMTPEKAKELGLRPRARFVSMALTGVDPEIMLTGPITVTPKVLAKAGLKLKDMDTIEINEAFASVVLAWQRELDPDMSKVNPNGGAVALGHPLGASGARLITTALHELERVDGRYALITMCIGYGIGIGTIIERF